MYLIYERETSVPTTNRLQRRITDPVTDAPGGTAIIKPLKGYGPKTPLF